jgi:hypothetical protein
MKGLRKARLDDCCEIVMGQAPNGEAYNIDRKGWPVIAAGDVEKAREQSEGLGLFVRSLVGLEREAAKQAFAEFLTGKTLNGNQIEFVNLIVPGSVSAVGLHGAGLRTHHDCRSTDPRSPIQNHIGSSALGP